MNTGWKLFLHNRGAVLGALVLLLIALAGLLGPQLYAVNPQDVVAAPLSPPSADAPLGPTTSAATCWPGCCTAPA